MSRPLLPTLRDPRPYRVTDVTRGTTLAARAALALGHWQRLVGLLGRTSLGEDEGLILPHCRSIHTWFMRMPIDVVVLDRDGRVLRSLERLSPWRITRPLWAAFAYLELCPGAITRARLRVGDQVTFE